MAAFVRHEPCPRCGSKDNLGRYDDGSAWCFGGCKYYEPPTLASRIANLKDDSDLNTVKKNKWFDLPLDCSPVYGRPAQDWLRDYPINLDKLRNNRVVWSHSRQQLIYKFVIEDRLVGWQARNFDPEELKKRKNFTSGEAAKIVMIYGDLEKRNQIVVVEDPLSAIIVGQVYPCTPLLGSHLTSEKLHVLCMKYDSIVFWLDPDKWTESCEMATRCEMTGTPARVISTHDDPKYYTMPQMFRIFGGDKL